VRWLCFTVQSSKTVGRLDFTVLIADDRITEDLVHDAFNSAGLLAGLGAGRPDFGRFIRD